MRGEDWIDTTIVDDVEPRDAKSLSAILSAESRYRGFYLAKIHPRFHSIAKREIIEAWKRAEDQTDENIIVSMALTAERMGVTYNRIVARRRHKMESWAFANIREVRGNATVAFSRTPDRLTPDEAEVYDSIYAEREGYYDSLFGEKGIK